MYVQVFLILNREPQFLVKKPGGQRHCGIPNISDFRSRLTYPPDYTVPSGTRASLPYANSFIFRQEDVRRLMPSGVNEEYALPWAKSGQVLLNEL